jgi:glycosyltransferase involved in cell wall biosynthesis
MPGPGSAIDLLLACLRETVDPSRALAATLVTPDIDWTVLVRTALSHGVTPLLAHVLDRVASDRVPGDIREAFRSHFDDNRARTDLLVGELITLLDVLAARGVIAIPFKGPSLGALAYGNPYLRRAGDLDLLVRTADLDVVCRALAEAGYREATERETGQALSAAEHAAYRRYQCEYAFVRVVDGLVVEPHWAIAPATWALPLDHERFWARRRTVALADRDVPGLALEDLLLVLSIHGAKHQWTELRWICDLAALIAREPAIDWRDALDRARAQRSERMLLLGLGLAARVLGARLPALAQGRLDADGVARALVDDVAARLFRPEFRAAPPSRLNRFHFRVREHAADRLRYAVKTITTPNVEQHIRPMRLPAGWSLLQLPAKLAHDYAALPLWRLARSLARLGGRLVRSRSGAGRVLVIDWVPHVVEGAGLPRMNAILRLLRRAGYHVTLHPVEPCRESPEILHADIPREIEVIRDRGLDDVERFLMARGREFSAILVSRPPTMARLAPIFVRRPGLVARASLVYDAEAIFAVCDIRRQQLLGPPLDDESAARRIADETRLSVLADAVTVVSVEEQALFRRHAGVDAHILPYPVEPAPTPRPFRDRRGLLFVGRIADDDWPNVDGLVWFRDRVFPAVRCRLAELGHDVALTVAGKTGATRLAAPRDPAIRFLGVVEELRPLYDEARVFIAPTRFAAGTPLKVYDAAARGLPVVGTRLLADQLGWRAGDDLLAGDVSSPEAFADNVVELYTDPDRWERVRANGLARIVADCSPERCLATLHDVLSPRSASR